MKALAVLSAVLFSASLASAVTVQLTADLDDAQETTCAMASSARGVGTFELDDLTGEFFYDITFGNNAPDFDDGALALGAEVAAHFHGPAAPGATAGITLGLGAGSPKQAIVFLNPDQVAQIKAGLWYVNVHSVGCPGGEIRGQVVPVVGGDTIVGVITRKLIAVDKVTAAGTAKVVYVSKDQAGGITKGTGTDTATISATFGLLATSPTSASGAFEIPVGASDGTSGWVVNKATVAKYVNKPAPAGPTGAKVVVIKPGKLLKIVGKSLGDTPFDVASLAESNQIIYTYFRVVNGGEATSHCSAFAPGTCTRKVIAGGTGAKLVCKPGFSDNGCEALPGSPSGAFLDE
jgi:hypothetical protein